jgi:hypothetical protein
MHCQLFMEYFAYHDPLNPQSCMIGRYLRLFEQDTCGEPFLANMGTCGGGLQMLA